jgi:indolepyruvate ferredoxin oxidoreductase alpha subunit
VQGGLYPALIRALQRVGLADAFGDSRIPLLVLNVTYPLVPRRAGAFCAGKARCWCWKRATPNTSRRTCCWRCAAGRADAGARQGPAARRRRIHRRGHGAGPAGLPLRYATATSTPPPARAWLAANAARRADVAALGPLPARPPGFCIGCPERPVFSALKLAQQEVGPVHVAADIGCHALRHLRALQLGPFDPGLRHEPGQPRRRVSPMMQRRSIAVMGDGGFWHNGLLTGVQAALFNGDDAVLLIMKNGYTSATGTQDILNTPDDEAKAEAERNACLHQSLAHKNQTIEDHAEGHGRAVAARGAHLRGGRHAAHAAGGADHPFSGLKVIVAEGECQLERQRRIKPWTPAA